MLNRVFQPDIYSSLTAGFLRSWALNGLVYEPSVLCFSAKSQVPTSGALPVWKVRVVEIQVQGPLGQTFRS